MARNSKTFAAQADGGGGFNPVAIYQNDTGIDLAGQFGTMQVSCSGLDSGTYKVEVLVPENPDWMEHAAAGIAANKITKIPGDLVVCGIRVTFAGTGGAAAPKVHLTQIGRLAMAGAGAA